ncbi:MAG: hypothetical protein J6S21_00345, partial [Victivallales bacterium]|nr:hypothetical protein [Victivallales bacterium]
AEFSLHDGAPFRLKDLTASRRELEFHFSIGNDFQWDKFAALLQTGDDDVNARINHIVLNKGSIFNGVIDFIFIHEGKIYILDWKSDLLKKDLASYRPEALADVMCGSGYDVQYHIYLAALMRYMEQRLGTGYSPELHDRYFGGVYYVFTRGVEPSRRNNGIYFCRPDYARMESIREIFGKA